MLFPSWRGKVIDVPISIYIYILLTLWYIFTGFIVCVYMSVNILYKVYKNEHSMQESNGISIIWVIFAANNDSDTWDFSYKNRNAHNQYPLTREIIFQAFLITNRYTNP